MGTKAIKVEQLKQILKLKQDVNQGQSVNRLIRC